MIDRRTLVMTVGAFVASRAHGADAYASALAAAWGGTIEATAAHRQAIGEIRRLESRADRLLRRLGLTRGAAADRIGALFDDDHHLYADDAAGRDQAVAAMNDRLARLRPQLVRAFGDLAMPLAQIRRMSPDDAARGRGGYREAGAYFVDLKAIRERPAWTLPSVAFHETVPGHAVQASFPPGSPERQVYLGVHAEAWATYAEQLAADLGAYADDPLGEIGFLHWRLFRMARVVGDIGQGAFGWSADHAVAAMRAIQGRAIAFTTLEDDVARMRRAPGAYAAQGLGALAMSRLRPRRITHWPHFHRSILTEGPWPGFMLAARAAMGSTR